MSILEKPPCWTPFILNDLFFIYILTCSKTPSKRTAFYFSILPACAPPCWLPHALLPTFNSHASFSHCGDSEIGRPTTCLGYHFLNNFNPLLHPYLATIYCLLSNRDNMSNIPSRIPGMRGEFPFKSTDLMLLEVLRHEMPELPCGLHLV